MNKKLLLTAVMFSMAAAAPGAVEERGNLVLDNIPQVETPLTTRLEEYLNSRGANFVDWLPDDTLLVATRFGDTEQLHRVATPLGAREQLTFANRSPRRARRNRRWRRASPSCATRAATRMRRSSITT
jgi:hypothetical protein